MINTLNDLEKQERELYYKEYEKQQSGTRAAGPISKNFGKVFYSLFETNFTKLTEHSFHFQKLNYPGYKDIKSDKNLLPNKVQNLLNIKNKRILDFGTGTGEFCNDISSKYQNSSVVGVDLATVDMGLTDEHSTQNCKFVSAGATELPFQDNSFDLITSFLALEHIHYENIEKLFSEFSRISKEGFMFQISHRAKNSNNMRRISEDLLWWYEKISKVSDDVCLYYFEKDNYKWGSSPIGLGMSRWVCAGVKK